MKLNICAFDTLFYQTFSHTHGHTDTHEHFTQFEHTDCYSHTSTHLHIDLFFVLFSKIPLFLSFLLCFFSCFVVSTLLSIAFYAVICDSSLFDLLKPPSWTAVPDKKSSKKIHPTYHFDLLFNICRREMLHR